MQKKKVNKKIVIAITIIGILLILLLSQTIIQSQNKRRLALLENTSGEPIEIKPNEPVVSAGMIPVKWDGEQWVITKNSDPDWYNYEEAKPAYIMLNDGVYQSELVRNMEQNGKKFASENLGVGIKEEELGTIFMWVPKFAYRSNEENKIERMYIKEDGQPEKGWAVLDTFLYTMADATKPDFLLSGVWIEKDVDTAYADKITQMNQEESIYGFIANTKASKIANIDMGTIYYASDTQACVKPILEITDVWNENRITLKVVNPNKIDPIKAKCTYNRIAGKIDVQVTYSRYGISKVLYEETEELKLLTDKNQAIATTEGIIDLEDGIRTITIVDNKGNQKKISITVRNCIYATLYDDGTMVFASNNNKIEGKGIIGDYGDISGTTIANASQRPWNNDAAKVKTVEIANKISPKTTAYWFNGCTNLTTINNIEKLDTSKVTDMSDMFIACTALTNLDVSKFDTSNVTNMNYMFTACTALTSLDVSKFDTSNVTSMEYMFGGCTSLISLDVSNFNTSKVTDMACMFSGCNALTSLDVSGFNTSKVTDMACMFSGCNALTSLDVSGFNKNGSNTSSVEDMSNMFDSCINLTKLTLGDFNTTSVEYMNHMFHNCRNLTELNVSSFDTSKVENMNQMFGYCHSLKELDLRNFDTSNANVLNIFRECVGLTKIQFGENWKKQVNLPEGTDWYRDEACTEANKIATGGDIYNPGGETTIYGKSTTPQGIYVKLYQGGTMTFATHNGKIPGTLNLDCGDISGKDFNTDAIPWNGRYGEVTTVDILNEISPTNTDGWFASFVNLTTINNIQNLNTSNVTDIDYMFSGCTSLTSLDVSGFDTSKVTDMSGMFDNCSSLTSLDVSNFNTSKVTDMSGMFNGCNNLTSLDVSNFDTSKVTNMNSMFRGCTSLTSLDISNFDTSKVTNMNSMFRGCTSLTSLDISNFDTNKAIYMNWMFNNCWKLKELDLSNFDTSSVTAETIAGIFTECASLSKIHFGENWNKTVTLPDGASWYSDEACTEENKVATNYTPIGEITIYRNIPQAIYVKLYENGTLTFASHNGVIQGAGTLIKNFGDILGKTYTYSTIPWSGYKSQVETVEFLDEIVPTTTTYWFASFNNLTRINNIEKLNTSQVTSMYWMFYGCNKLTELNVSSFDTKNVVNMKEMFNGCTSLTELNVSNFNTSNVTNMSYMFRYCTKLTELDVSSFDTRKVSGYDNYRSIFAYCTNLKKIYVGEIGKKWTLPNLALENCSATIVQK